MRWVDPLDGRPRRHARVWLDPAGWRATSSGASDDDARDLGAWIAGGRAVVARRGEPGSAGSCALAIALPLAAGRRRIAFTAHPAAIVRVEPPVALDEAIGAAPVAWRPALRSLRDGGRRIGVDFRVYGSLAWQFVSGEPCIAATSDVDLLWTATDGDQIERGLRLLFDWEADSRLRADGEYLLPNGDGIAWRELAGDATRVLVKHRDRVSLQPSPRRGVVGRSA